MHKELGPGLLESVYEKCLKYELIEAGFTIKSQISVPVLYKGENLDCDLKLDLLVNDLLIIELKSVEIMNSVFKAQLLTYLKLLNKSKGLLINFNCEVITNQLVSLVTPLFSSLPKNNILVSLVS